MNGICAGARSQALGIKITVVSDLVGIILYSLKFQLCCCVVPCSLFGGLCVDTNASGVDNPTVNLSSDQFGE
jgi:hypothetical protein